MSTDRRIGVIETFRATPTAVRYLLTGVLINQLGAFVQTFLVLYLTFRGASLGLAGVCIAAYSVGSIFGTLLGGELTHRVGPRVTIVAAMFCSGPLVALIPWFTGSQLLIVVVGLAGLVTQAYRPAAAVLLSDLMPARYQTMAFSMMRTALNVGAAIAPLIAAGLILINWDLLFWLDGGTALVYSALAFTLLPKAAAPARAATKTARVERRSVYAIMAQDRRFLFYLAAVFVGTVAYMHSTTTLPLEIVKDGYPIGLYSAVLALSSVVLITFELKITTYTTQLPPSVAAFLGQFVDGIGIMLYALAALSPAIVVIGAALVVSGRMIGGPAMFAHPAQFPAAVKSRYISTMQAVAGVASTVGPVLGLWAWNLLGGGLFWPLCGALTVLAAVFSYVGLRRSAVADRAPEVVGDKA